MRGAGHGMRGGRTHLVHLCAQPAEHRHAAQPPGLLALQALQLAAERVELGRAVGEGHGAQLAAAVPHGDGGGEQRRLLRAYERALDECARRVEHTGRAAVVGREHVRVTAPMFADPLEDLWRRGGVETLQEPGCRGVEVRSCQGAERVGGAENTEGTEGAACAEGAKGAACAEGAEDAVGAEGAEGVQRPGHIGARAAKAVDGLIVVAHRGQRDHAAWCQ